MPNAAALIFDGTAVDADTTSKTVNLASLSKGGRGAAGFIVSWDVSNTSGGTPTFDMDIEHSPDNNVWFSAVSMTQATTTASEVKIVTTNVHSLLRANITLGGTTPQADIKIWIEETQPATS
jgi:hypothetical protein